LVTPFAILSISQSHYIRFYKFPIRSVNVLTAIYLIFVSCYTPLTLILCELNKWRSLMEKLQIIISLLDPAKFNQKLKIAALTLFTYFVFIVFEFSFWSLILPVAHYKTYGVGYSQTDMIYSYNVFIGFIL